MLSRTSSRVRPSPSVAVKDTRDQRHTRRVVIDHPGGQADGRIRDSVQRLRVGPHLECIGHVRLEEQVSFSQRRVSSSSRPAGAGPPDSDRRSDVGSNSTRKVGVDAEQTRRRLHAHQIDDLPAPVAALSGVAVVSQAVHQHRPGTRDVVGTPAGLGRLSGVPVARHRRDHQMEGIRRAARRVRWDWSADR